MPLRQQHDHYNSHPLNPSDDLVYSAAQVFVFIAQMRRDTLNVFICASFILKPPRIAFIDEVSAIVFHGVPGVGSVFVALAVLVRARVESVKGNASHCP